jgi:lipopolysaccharide transport system ATP-binding protein
MSDTIISVENLGKRYSIRHQRGERYTTLRDALAEKATRLFRRNNGSAQSSHEDFWALKDVSFEVKRGEVLGIIGRNGAGKSTLLKILSRITEPTEGRVRIRGRVASLLEVGTGFHPELTGRENIFLNGAILGMSRVEIKKKFDEIVAFAEIEKFLDTPVKRFSSGMYVRLAFAVAAHLEPEILLVDEVLAVGDAEFQKKSLGKMKDVGRGGRTVLFVSHNMGAISGLCPRSLMLDTGRAVHDGPSDEVIESYLGGRASSKALAEVRYSERKGDAFVTRIAVLDSQMNPSAELDVRKDFYVCLEYSMLSPIRNIDAGIAVFNFSGSKVFFSARHTSVATGDLSLPGDYRSLIKVPGLFLAPGFYTLSGGLDVPNVRVVDYRVHAISFQICETGSKAAIYAGADLGSVLVRLDWETAKT